MVVLGAGTASYERGTPVRCRVIRLSHDIAHARRVAPTRVLVVSLAKGSKGIHATLAVLPPDTALGVLPPPMDKDIRRGVSF